MTFNAASRLRSLEDRSAALGSSRCELPGMHSVPKSALLPYASGVGGLSRRLLNRATPYVAAAGGRSASGDAFLQEIPTTGEDFQCPRPPPEKHHEHRFAQHPHSKIQRADVRLLGGYLRQE